MNHLFTLNQAAGEQRIRGFGSTELISSGPAIGCTATPELMASGPATTTGKETKYV
ncbi:hypothetical protein SV7mr_53280 [Stieleria bergensis]|uniref:Uncharacterized protein n=1 Tax=Stieleria bergensis TaxID=2528025 RepID=A0A517T316_9BACT|nr:hypothetical protein SV7mr_53280 [Planctomycetes bacterium SV_7m_r]